MRKIRINYDANKPDGSGRHKFLWRLQCELEKLGFEYTEKGAATDITLFLSQPSSKARFNIYRIDGVWINTEQDWENRNEKIAARIKIADGVIYQNEFCRKAVRKILHTSNSREICIGNGVDPNEFVDLRFKHSRLFFLAMCKWRPHKRARETAYGFVHADLANVDLLVLGEVPEADRVSHPSVRYLGWKGTKMVNSMLASPQCIGTIHLAWLDWCPNSVVESLVAGKQVIHTTSGGTPFVVKGRGYCVPDARWDFKPLRLYEPPLLDIEKIAFAYRQSILHPIANFDSRDLSISRVAQQYADFLRS